MTGLATTVRVLCIPSRDTAFQRAVAVALDRLASTASEPDLTPEALREALCEFYPKVSVRRRDLSGDAGWTWYAYRDGIFQAEADPDWPASERTAWAAWDATTGVVLRANGAFEAMFGLEGRSSGLHYSTFLTPRAIEMAAAVFAMLARGESGRSVARVRRGDGTLIDVEWVAELVDGEIHDWYRPASLAESERMGATRT